MREANARQRLRSCRRIGKSWQLGWQGSDTSSAVPVSRLVIGGAHLSWFSPAAPRVAAYQLQPPTVIGASPVKVEALALLLSHSGWPESPVTAGCSQPPPPVSPPKSPSFSVASFCLFLDWLLATLDSVPHLAAVVAFDLGPVLKSLAKLPQKWMGQGYLPLVQCSLSKCGRTYSACLVIALSFIFWGSLGRTYRSSCTEWYLSYAADHIPWRCGPRIHLR
jgi:hypothetical protein